MDVVISNRAGAIGCLYANRNAPNIVADERSRSEDCRITGRPGARADDVAILDTKVGCSLTFDAPPSKILNDTVLNRDVRCLN